MALAPKRDRGEEADCSLLPSQGPTGRRTSVNLKEILRPIAPSSGTLRLPNYGKFVCLSHPVIGGLSQQLELSNTSGVAWNPEQRRNEWQRPVHLWPTCLMPRRIQYQYVFVSVFSGSHDTHSSPLPCSPFSILTYTKIPIVSKHAFKEGAMGLENTKELFYV